MESQLARKENETRNKERAREVELELEEKMPKDKRQREHAQLKTASVQAVAATSVPETLLVLESCLLDGIDCVHLLLQVHIPLLINWESQSSILQNGLVDMKWWETQFKVSHPVTYERLVSFPPGAVRTMSEGADEIDRHNFWKSLLLSDLPDRRVWRETIQFGGVSWQARHAIQCNYADEIGDDRVHQLLFDSDKSSSGHASERRLPLLRTFSWNATSDDSVSESYFDFNKQPGIAASHASSSSSSFFTVAQMWTLSFRDACLVLLQNQSAANSGDELVWVQTGIPLSCLSQAQDLRYWTLNRNVFLEDSNDFVIPMHFGCSLNQDESPTAMPLQCMYPVLVCSTNDCTAVVLEGKICLIFDNAKMKSNRSTKVPHENVEQKVQQEPAISHWRHLLTDEFCEPYRGFSRQNFETAITASCYVLDAFLLLATNDGVMRARPRSNPKSEYHVESTNSLVSRMTSLYNVVAVVHSYCIMEIRQVFRIDHDPFVGFKMLFETKGVDCDHAPLVYGPYVIFAGLDGCWYRVMYDSSFPNVPNAPRVKEEIKIPYHAGWKIVSVKNANRRYWTVVVQHPVSKDVSEVFLFAGGQVVTNM
jgi:hypothetical protein